MNDEQEVRHNRMLVERHYWLGVQITDTHIEFAASGSTGNVYEQKIVIATRAMTCTCPDFNDRAAMHGVFCKHCCFILFRVLHCDAQALYSCKRRKLSRALFAHIRDAAARLCPVESPEHKGIVNPQYLQRYRAQTIDAEAKSDEYNFGIGTRQQWAGDAAALQRIDESECAVCFEKLRDSEVLVRCGECLNFVHRECLDIWLKGGKNRACLYCRAQLVYALYEAPKKRRRRSDEEYVNVAQQ